MSRVAVIGGGAAGMVAAAAAAQRGHEAVLIEKNEKLGKKLFITGKGRCNVTNAADLEEFFRNIPRNPKFLYSALYGFSNDDTVSLLHEMGTPTKVERGNRVFPASDKSSDVIRALSTNVRRSGAEIRLNTRMERIFREGEGFCLTLNGKQEFFDAVILCTGGMSYPATGSTGDGFAFAQSLGHSITQTQPSLIPLETAEAWPKELMGLSLRNVTLSVICGKKTVYSELGEMLFTHFGVSGPLVLSASSRIPNDPAGTVLKIDLKPGLTLEELDRRILRDFDKNIRRQFSNALDELLPSKLIPVIVALSGIAPNMPVNSITRQQREALGRLLKELTMTVRCARPIEEALVTRGGVFVKEINSSTMESKLVPNLYFAGEMIDVDGYTGGYNLQIAFSTGVCAGRSVR